MGTLYFGLALNVPLYVRVTTDEDIKYDYEDGPNEQITVAMPRKEAFYDGPASEFYLDGDRAAYYETAARCFEAWAATLRRVGSGELTEAGWADSVLGVERGADGGA